MEQWDAVAAAITARLAALQMTQQELSSAAGVSPATIRELQHGRRRSSRGRTLAALSTALRWPPTYLAEVLRGERPTDGESDGSASADPVLTELRGMHELLREINQRLDQLEEKIERDDGQ